MRRRGPSSWRPFRINRSPIHAGVTLIPMGWALALGAFSALIPAALYSVLVAWRFVLAEDAGLRSAFGPDAARPLACARRW